MQIGRMLLVVFGVCPLLYGQATGIISGTVSDASGSAIAGAKVVVTAPAVGLTRDSRTDESGHYLVPLLPVASFTVRVEFTGFQPAEQKEVRLQVDEHREVDFKLAPASVKETVEVTATAVAVETANPTLGQVITSQQVAELPLNGRDFVQLATLTPGTITETNPQSFFNGGPSSEVSARGSFSLSVGGSRANSTDWLYDGNDNNELTAGGIAILPSIDAIQEFKVLTYNYSAEYGTRAGPTVLVTTKNGTNDFHGSLFEFFRNTDLDARSFFASNTEQFNLNQFGGSLGGPIQKDKTFFFADYQAKMQRHGIPYVGLVPSAAMRNGDFTDDAFGNPNSEVLNNPYVTTQTSSGTVVNHPFMCDSSGNALPAAADGSQSPGTPCNKIPQGLINPIGQAMINLYPLPNANNPALGYNYVNEPVRALNEGEFDIRLDHNFSTRDSMFARFSYDQAKSFVPGGSPGFAEQSAFASTENIDNHGRNAALSETHIFSPRTVNQFSIGFNRILDYFTSYGSGTCEASKLGIPGANSSAGNPLEGANSCGLTSTELAGYWSLGDRGYSPFLGGTNVFSISDSFDMVRGKHDIRIGGNIRANELNVLAVGFQDGFWDIVGDWGGDPAASLMMGLTDLAIHDQAFDGDVTGRRWKMYRPFVQDDWRVSKDLTLNLGLAWATHAYAGNLTLSFSQIYTLSGGDITLLVPGGGINVGLASVPPQLSQRAPSTLGIVAEGSGNVDIYTQSDIDVNSSRIFTLGGGNILIWSDQGSIDAGKGAKTSVSAPPPTVSFNSNGTVSLNFAGAATGSGIRTIQTDPNAAAGDVDLIAPVGTVTRGTPVSGAAGNINIAARSVIGASNINFGGTATGVPAAISSIGASLSGASSWPAAPATPRRTRWPAAPPRRKRPRPSPRTHCPGSMCSFTGLGEENCKPDDIECLKRQKTPTR